MGFIFFVVFSPQYTHSCLSKTVIEIADLKQSDFYRHSRCYYMGGCMIFINRLGVDKDENKRGTYKKKKIVILLITIISTC